MNEIDPDKTLRQTITVTEFRRRMSHYVGAVRYGDDWLRITRKNADPVYLVSETDFRLICEAVDDLEGGPRDPATGTRTGRGFMHWVREAFRADREKVAEAPAPETSHSGLTPEERRAKIGALLASAEAGIEEYQAMKAEEDRPGGAERMAAARERMRAKREAMRGEGNCRP